VSFASQQSGLKAVESSVTLKESAVFALLKNAFMPTPAEIEMRARVNRIHTMTGPERVDGLVINIQRGVAYVAWPNGDTTIESLRHLVPIID
jgi:hypothetical protein